MGQTEQQVAAMVDLRLTPYAGTPSFLHHPDKADELGVKIDSLSKAFVSGEAFPPSQREALWRAASRPTGVCHRRSPGLVAFETPAREGLVVDEDVALRRDHAPRHRRSGGARRGGRRVVTSFNPDYPLIRFGTGDLSAVLPGASPCGRTNMHQGLARPRRSDHQVKGMFVHPGQVVAVLCVIRNWAGAGWWWITPITPIA